MLPGSFSTEPPYNKTRHTVGGQPLEPESQGVVGAVYVGDATFEGATKQFVLRIDIREDESSP